MAKEVMKLSFASNLAIDVKSGWNSNKDEKHPGLLIAIWLTTEKKDQWGHQSQLKAKEVKIEKTADLIKKVDKFESEINEIQDQISHHETRLSKISGRLATMDREERRARAMIVESKLKSMEGGEELVDYLTSNMPEI